MRGQEPGSEHDRREADRSAAPATPPPSFGQTNGRSVPPASTPSDEAADAESLPVIPVFEGSPPNPPDSDEPPGAQPWEVPADDATPYDWFDDHAHTDPGGPGQVGGHEPEPTHPGADPNRISRLLNTGPTSVAHLRDQGLSRPHDTGPPQPGQTWPGGLHDTGPSEPDHTRPGRLHDTGPQDRVRDAAAHDTHPDHFRGTGPAQADLTRPGHLPARGPSAFDLPHPGRPHDVDPDHTLPGGLHDTGPSQPGPFHGSDHTRPAGLHETGPSRSDPFHGSDQTRPGHLYGSWPPRPAAAQDGRQTGPIPGGQGEQPPSRDMRPWDAPEDPGPWPADPVVPGAPPWEPPPAFTAAAAGMPVWPAPITDPHAMPPWPAATGELEAEPDADEPALPPPFDPNATNPEGFTRPVISFDPETTPPEPVALQDRTPPDGTPLALPPDTSPTRPGLTPPASPLPHSPASATPPAPGTRSDQAAADRRTTTAQEPSDQHPKGPLAAPVAAEHTETQPFSHDDIARPATDDTQTPTNPAHYFDPKAAKRDAAHPAHVFDSHGNPSTRPPEPGDVPVWPPIPPTGDKLPELPFPRETWGQKPTTSLDLPTPPGGSPAFPPGAFKQPPFQTPPPPPAPQGKSKRALFVTLGALALAGVATGGFFAFQAVSKPKPTTAAARPSEPAQVPTVESTALPPEAAGTSMLNSEQTDPQKLSLSEAFPKKKVSAAGTTFIRVKAGMETSCDKAATGAFAEALKEQKCTRVLRATYVDGKRRYAVTTGIAVLPDKTAATTADQAKDLARNIWFRPLPGAAGSGGERVHIAGGYAAGMVWGRYIVFSYATHTDGHTPEAKEKTLPKVSGAFRDQTSLVLERRVTKG
ncbi:hypothetical protein [Nonomuraea sp. NPDC050643]|uniref:hypothetical protein n=1 Tax=Nonomuraea sp. NPDC050643 TaxID=3155660 RepID=UPI0033E3946A